MLHHYGTAQRQTGGTQQPQAKGHGIEHPQSCDHRQQDHTGACPEACQKQDAPDTLFTGILSHKGIGQGTGHAHQTEEQRKAAGITEPKNLEEQAISLVGTDIYEKLIKQIAEGGYIVVEKGGHIVLTESGKEIAEKIYNRHTLLTKFLTSIGVDEEVAAEDACKMEHIISDESFAAIKKHAGF